MVRLDDARVAFAYGRYIVAHQIDTGEQLFSHALEAISCIVSCTDSPILAVGEAGPVPCVSLLDAATLRRRKQLKPPPGQCKVWVGICFAKEISRVCDIIYCFISNNFASIMHEYVYN